jgi:hypothetical protein
MAGRGALSTQNSSSMAIKFWKAPTLADQCNMLQQYFMSALIPWDNINHSENLATAGNIARKNHE